ncbi:stress protein [Streptomyces sp. NPDC003042]
MNRKRMATALISTVVAAGILLPSAAAHAAEAPPVQRAASVQGAIPGEVSAQGLHIAVAAAVLDITRQVMRIATEAVERNQNRSGYVKSLMEGSFYESGQRYNVMVINDENRYSTALNGVVYDAKVSGVHGRYRVLVFESGQFTNQGDGGWINWAFRGWFDRDGGHVNFRRSW